MGEFHSSGLAQLFNTPELRRFALAVLDDLLAGHGPRPARSPTYRTLVRQAFQMPPEPGAPPEAPSPAARPLPRRPAA